MKKIKIQALLVYYSSPAALRQELHTVLVITHQHSYQSEPSMADNQAFETPQKVALAVKLLYAIIGIGIIRTIILVIRHWDVRTPDFILLSSIFIWTVSIFLVQVTGKGRNWARWTLAAIFTITIPLSILPMFASLAHNPIPNLLGLVQVILYVWALVLLFHPTSTAWFKAIPLPTSLKTHTEARRHGENK